MPSSPPAKSALPQQFAFTPEHAAPEIAVEAVDKCPVCGCGRHELYAEGFDYEMETCSNRWRFVACEDCRHVWLNPRPALETLGTIYPPTYYAYNYGTAINSLALRGKQWLDRRKMAGIVRALGRPPRSYLDIGCGDGRFLKLLERSGVARDRLYGIELDPRVVAPLSEAGYRAFCERVEDCRRIPEEGIDLITIFHVIEHVDDPSRVLRRIASWLAPGGIVAIETPNLNSQDARIYKRTFWGGYHYPRHWNLFCPETLRRIIEEQGLRHVATRYQTGHSFWLYSFQHGFRHGKHRRPGLARWVQPIGGSLLPLLAVTAWDKARAALGFKTSAMLMIARKPDRAG
jgi:2-polyprenyl-3-methyl-5-hydroxy-6-metoxy-1,4-benzoquinol methylase